MSVVVIIFMIISMIFALASLGYTAVDVVLEVKGNNAAKKVVVQEEPAPVEPVVEEEPPEVMPEPVDHIDANEADSMLSDSLAMKTVCYETGAGHGQQGIINIGVLDANFNADDVITLALLKEKGLISRKVGRLKILADGILNKPLTIKAESYSIQAIKMIELTGGKAVILKG